jgi:AraC-like DNA-binding protein
MDFFRAFGSPSQFAQEFLLFTDGLGHLKSRDFHIDRDTFNDNLIMYVLSGKLHVEQKGHHILGPGEGIVMKLTEQHKYYTDESDICEILWMHFNGRQAGVFINYLEQNFNMPLIFEEPSVKKSIMECFRLFNDKISEREYKISHMIYGILMMILHWVQNEKEPMKSNARTEFVKKISSYIDSNIYNKITLKDMALEMNMSRYHFCRVFENYFHITPMKYVLMKKIEQSKYLLAYTNDSISIIASSLGFVDQSHFSKTFKGFEKQTPLNYRKGSRYKDN